MSMPQNVLSTEVIRAQIIGARGLPVTDIVDYETAGKGYSDPSEGLDFQIWRARISPERTQILMSAPNTPEFVELTGVDFTSVSMAFDRNMRPALAYVEDGTPKFRWYDTTVPGDVITTLPAGAITPRVVHDDKRDTQSAISDVLLFFVVDGELFMRRQRDRYETDYSLATGYPKGILKVGMNLQNRLQIMMKA